MISPPGGGYSSRVCKTDAPKRKKGSVPMVTKKTVAQTSVCITLIQAFFSSLSSA